jgi:hypothetical protein
MKYLTRFFQAGNLYFAVMTDAISTLVRSLFQKESLHDCTLEQLQTIAREYPYFSPVQLLLAEKLRSVDENLYKEQIQKLSLYFTNPLWLDYRMNGYKSTAAEVRHESMPEHTHAEVELEKEAPDVAVHQQVAEFADTVSNEISPTHNERVETLEDNQGDHEALNFETPIQKEEAENAERIEDKTNEPVIESSSAVMDLPAVEESEDSITHSREEAPHNEEPEPDLADEEELVGPLPMPPLPDLKQEPVNTELTFEPYHTVDYFASQGIKFVPEERPTDRFGQQLKSFTEWLKTLKRLPEMETKPPDVAAEEKVKQLADHSISKDEVVTETMAEVWVKQGNKEKAIETYNKLSLLNPGKSAYFASLVEQLKNS